MTDKEIARLLRDSRWWARHAKTAMFEDNSRWCAKESVMAIHRIINSINWED